MGPWKKPQELTAVDLMGAANVSRETLRNHIRRGILAPGRREWRGLCEWSFWQEAEKDAYLAKLAALRAQRANPRRTP